MGLEIPLIADYSVVGKVNCVAGGNKADVHLINVNIYRDYKPTQIADVREAKAGDQCVHCGGVLASARGTEVGQVFKLGTKYSQALRATFLDENGEEKPFIMGCYGIGVSRTMAAIIEQHHDEDGICWPISVAPYHVIIVPVSYKDEEQKRAAEELYQSMLEAGIEVVIDDRDERPGVKFKDADLIGYPFRITIGPKHLKDGNVELYTRSTRTQTVVPLSQVCELIKTHLDS